MQATDKLTQKHLELLKSFSHIKSEEQLKEIKSLLNYYFRDKLDKAIDRVEKDRNYTAETYEKWLNSSNDTTAG